MQVTETLTEGLKREFKVVVSAEDIEGKVTSKLIDLGKSIRLPGFRPGKVPFSLLKKRYGEALRGEVLEEAVNDSTQQAISESGLKPALQPKIEVTRFEEGTDLEYTMAVEVLPEIVPTDFSTLQLERLRVTVDDEDVERMLQRMADEQKSYVAAAEGHEAGEGNALVIDFAGTIDGEPFEGGSAEDYQLVLGSSTFLPGFEEQLVGVKSGDRRPLEVGFPDDYPAPNLAGKTASFEVTVKEVREAEPVTIDDALAERYGLADLAALREAMRNQVSQEYEGISRRILKRKLLDALAASHDFEVPPSLVDAEFEAIWKQFEEAKERGEPDPADADRDEEEIKAEYRVISERRVRLGLLLAQVGEGNNIIVQQDEVNRALAEQARRFPGQERKIIEYYQNDPQALAQIKAPLFEEKVVDFICEMAEVSEREVSSQELIQGEDVEANESAAEAADERPKKSTKKKPRTTRAKGKQVRKPAPSEGSQAT